MKNPKPLTTLPLILTLLASLALAACSQPADDPEAAAKKYWLYLQNGNIKEAEKLITIDSKQAFTGHMNRVTPRTRINTSAARTTVDTTITSTNTDASFKHSETFKTTLVLEQGQWKIDITQTPIPPAPTAREEQMQQMADELSDTMQDNIESIDDAMNQGVKLFNEAMQEGSKEMSDSLLKLMNELNRSMKDSIETMKQRRLEHQQQQEQQPQQRPEIDPGKGEGMI
ncbi:MAG: hypothetical protein IMF14_09190 [Proteobacteria bacterium]|nr:hypothetical protein [Pseudomonadota bacterium]